MYTTRSHDDSGAHIFLLDEHPGGRAARKAILEAQGHTVRAAANVEEALVALGAGSFDVAVVNHRDAAAELRRLREVAPAIGIILLLEWVEAMGRTEAETGADVILTKDCNEVGRLIRAVNRLVRLRRTRKSPQSDAPPPPGRRKAAGA
jgi:CheY-like chemotaxis protein